MASSQLVLTFRIHHGDRFIREERLAQTIIKIGKVASAHLRIDDESVSRMHAIIEVTGGTVSIIDLGSTRGTMVNGKKINKATLQSGDAITLGEARIELAIAEAVAAAKGAGGADAEGGVAAPARGAAQAATAVAAAASAAAPAGAAPVPGGAQAATAVAATPAPARGAAQAATAVGAAPAPAIRAGALPPPVPAPPPRLVALPPAAVPLVDDAHAPRAIEVAAMLGDSVVNVKHCLDPRGGRITTTTWTLFAVALASLAASALAFVLAVRTAAHNKAALDYHTRVLHKPAYSFRPRAAGAGVSWVAFGGLAIGLAAATAGLARARRERRSPYFRIGTAAGVEQPVEGLAEPSFPLVAPSGDDFVMNLGPGIEGELVAGGVSTPLSELATAPTTRPSAIVPGAVELAIPAAARIRAHVGGATFLISSVARPADQRASLLALLDGRPMKYVAGSLVAHLAIVLLLSQVAVADSGVNVELSSREGLTTSAAIRASEAPPPADPERDDGTDDGSDGAPNDGAAMALTDGAAGDPKETRDTGKLRIKDNHREPSISREEAIAQARDAGVLGSSLLVDSISSVAASNNFSSGFDGENVLGPLDGYGGPGRGFGMGRDGTGPGGGCLVPPCGIVGTGRYATIRSGKYAGDGYFAGNGGNGPLRNHLAQPPIYSQPTGIPDGTLDKAIIKRYIKRHEAKIAFCYEKELLARPGIAGTVTIQFLIAPDGTVQSSVGEGFDATVATCVANVIQTITFPAPKHGGNVAVNYPFRFRFAGH